MKATITYHPTRFSGYYTVPATTCKHMLNSYVSFYANTGKKTFNSFIDMGALMSFFNPNLVEIEHLKYVYARSKNGNVSKLVLVDCSSWMHDSEIEVLAYVVGENDTYTAVTTTNNFTVFSTAEEAANQYSSEPSEETKPETKPAEDSIAKEEVHNLNNNDKLFTDIIAETASNADKFACKNNTPSEDSAKKSNNACHHEYVLCFNNQRLCLVRHNDEYMVNEKPVDEATYHRIEELVSNPDITLTSRIKDATAILDTYYEEEVKAAEKRVARRKHIAELEAELLRLKEEEKND